MDRDRLLAHLNLRGRRFWLPEVAMSKESLAGRCFLLPCGLISRSRYYSAPACSYRKMNRSPVCCRPNEPMQSRELFWRA